MDSTGPGFNQFQFRQPFQEPTVLPGSSVVRNELLMDFCGEIATHTNIPKYLNRYVRPAVVVGNEIWVAESWEDSETKGESYLSWYPIGGGDQAAGIFKKLGGDLIVRKLE
jgi:hypothetical protein